MTSLRFTNSTTQTRRGTDFLALLPDIERTARSACRGLDPEAREDAVAEAVADAFVSFVRLCGQGRPQAATAASLARFGVRHFFAGRRIGSRLAGNDVLSPYARRKHRFRLERIDRDGSDGGWRDVLVEDRTATPADLAASRIDVPAWFESLPPRHREIAMTLADGHSPGEVAGRFRLSPGRVSQLRRELAERWAAFHGEVVGEPRRGLAGAA